MSFAQTELSPLTVEGSARANGTLALRIDQEVTVTPELMQQQDGLLRLKGLTLRADPEAKEWTIQSSDRDVRIEAGPLPGLTAFLGNASQVGIQLAAQPPGLRLRTPKTLTHPVRLHLPDGGSAEMQDESSIRFEWFADRSYLLTGQGRVSALSADGHRMQLGPQFPPLAGGPLVLVTDAQQGSRFERRRPTIPVRLAGDSANAFTLAVGSHVLTLAESQKERLDLPNGSVLRLEHVPRRGELRWHVQRGDFRWSLEGLPGWKAIGLSGQSASLLWDPDHQAVDLTNLSAEDSLLVSLANQSFLQILPGATLQCRQVAPKFFALAAREGRVNLHHSASGQTTDLGRGNLLVKSGLPVEPGRAGALDQIIRLTWPSRGLVEAQTAFGKFTIEPPEAEHVRGPYGSQIEFQLSEHGELRLQALAGRFTIHPHPESQLTIELAEGRGLTLSSSTQTGSVTAQASAENTGPVPLRLAEGWAPLLYPAESITLLGTSWRAGGGPTPHAVFGAGLERRDRPTGGGAAPADEAWPFGRYHNQLNESRIPQPPVSVAR